MDVKQFTSLWPNTTTFEKSHSRDKMVTIDIFIANLQVNIGIIQCSGRDNIGAE